MAGIPGLFGLSAKGAAYEAGIDSGLGNAAVVLGGLVAGSALTLAYSLRLVWGAFVTPHRRAPREPADGVKRPAEVKPPSPGFLLPGAVVAALRGRSEESLVGNGGVSTLSSRWSPASSKNTTN